MDETQGFCTWGIQTGPFEPVQLILSQNFSNFLIFILGLPFLITPERGRKEATGAENGKLELFPVPFKKDFSNFTGYARKQGPPGVPPLLGLRPPDLLPAVCGRRHRRRVEEHGGQALQVGAAAHGLFGNAASNRHNITWVHYYRESN